MLALLAALLIGEDSARTAGGPATLAILQGTIETSVGGTATPPIKPGDSVDAGTLIKTNAGSRATFVMADGSELRINENTSVSIEGPRKFDLKFGRIFVKIVQTTPPFEINTEHVPIFINQALADIEFSQRVPNGAPAATTIRVVEGSANTTSKKFKARITAGFYNTAIGSQLNTPDPMGNSSLTTAWIHPLLVERGVADEETQARAMELIEILGRESSNDPAEAALRLLADLATAELVRFLTKTANGPQPARRTAAVRIIAETGTMKSAAGMVSLLQNPEASTRVVAAQGLARLAGKDLGFNEAYWKGETLEKGQKAWEDWVRQNAAK